MRFFSPGLWPDWFWFFFRSFLAAIGSVRAEKIQASSLEKQLLETVAAIVLPTSKNRPIEGSWCSLFFFFFYLIQNSCFWELPDDEKACYYLEDFFQTSKSLMSWWSGYLSQVKPDSADSWQTFFWVSSFDCWVLLFFSESISTVSYCI